MKYGYLPVLALALAGCGGGSDEGTDTGQGSAAPLSVAYAGVWGIDGVAVVMISQGSVATYVFDDTKGCYEADFFNVVASTANSLTSKDVTTGEQSTTSFSLAGAALKLKEGNDELELPALQNFWPTPGCANPQNLTTVTAELELASIPPAVTINRAAQQSGYVEYRYAISFDLNKNGKTDVGDIDFTILHFKNTQRFPDNYSLPLVDLGAQIWTHYPENGTGRLLSTSSSPTMAIGLQQQGNTLTLVAQVPQHAALMRLSADTPVKVQAYIHYPQPETAALPGYVDGPWNWSDTEHIDLLPESGTLVPNTLVEQRMTDPGGDLIKGQAQWADIKSLKLTYN
ncbi:hypothetical protein [Rheinheimera sp.]|uniref:hypothetical protein n=1 Tax=Rheinheimera sp. TaxID=1869214 RepID=UPI00307DCEC1